MVSRTVERVCELVKIGRCERCERRLARWGKSRTPEKPAHRQRNNHKSEPRCVFHLHDSPLGLTRLLNWRLLGGTGQSKELWQLRPRIERCLPDCVFCTHFGHGITERTQQPTKGLHPQSANCG